VGQSIDCQPIGHVELVKDPNGRLFASNQPVVAQRIIGSRIALLIPGGQVGVSLADYWRVLRTDGAAADT